MQKNLFKRHNGVSATHKMSYTAIFLAAALLLQFASRYMQFANTFIDLNLSLLFILPIFYYAGFLYGVMALLVRLAIGILITVLAPKTPMPIPLLVFGEFILLICSTIAIAFMYLFSSVFNKVKNHNVKTCAISLSTTLSVTIVATFLNMIFFTPAYFNMFNKQSFSIPLAIQTYSKLKVFFFGIENYWLGTFVVYFSGNLVKFGLIYIIYFPFAKVLRSFHPTISYGKDKNSQY